MSKTSPSSIDSHIGYKLKMLRLKQGKSLNEIGDLLGVSFQQIQKYEKGTNKISSSNLFLLADRLNSSIDYFFEGIHKDVAPSHELREKDDVFNYNFLSSPSHIADSELVILVKSYSKIKDSNIRRSILDLMRAL